MLTSYRRVLSVPGALRFSATGLVARLPISMEGLGIVLLVVAVTGSYGFAGAVAAAATIANALVAVLQARYVDRLGQTRVLPPLILVWAAAVAALVLTVHGEWPHWTSYASAVVVGLTLPPVGTCVRARWAYVLDEPAQVRTAYALESAADEAVFIIGPILVTALATAWDPVAGLAAMVVAGLGGTLYLAAQRSTSPPPHRKVTTVEDRPRMPWRTVVPLGVVALALGALFGSAEVATVAFATERGHQGVTGVLLALWSLGSLLAGVIVGAVQVGRSLAFQVRADTIALTCGMAPLVLIEPIWLMGVALFVAGFAIAPGLIAAFSLVQRSVPAARLTEGMAVVHTGLAAGLAPGAAIGGHVIDAAGASAAFVVPAAAGLVASLAAQTLPRTRPQHPPATP
jgi:predicted MFS family arabinose efflux permease